MIRFLVYKYIDKNALAFLGEHQHSFLNSRISHPYSLAWFRNFGLSIGKEERVKLCCFLGSRRHTQEGVKGERLSFFFHILNEAMNMPHSGSQNQHTLPDGVQRTLFRC